MRSLSISAGPEGSGWVVAASTIAAPSGPTWCLGWGWGEFLSFKPWPVYEPTGNGWRVSLAGLFLKLERDVCGAPTSPLRESR